MFKVKQKSFIPEFAFTGVNGNKTVKDSRVVKLDTNSYKDVKNIIQDDSIIQD